MVYKSLNELKSISREKMLGKYGTAVGAFLFMRGLLWLVTDLCRSVANPTGIIFLAILFILALIEGVFVYGEQGIYMKIASGQQARMNDMFMVFKGDADKAIFARFLWILIIYVPLTVSGMALYYAYKAQSMLILGAILVTAILLVAMAYLLITYSQVLLVMHDFPQMKVIDSFKRSRLIMKGRKLDFFKVFVSFIPLHMLGILSFMAGELFVHPYYKLTVTEFYFDTVKAPVEAAMPNGFDAVA